MEYDEPTVRVKDHRLYVRDHPGSEPAIILMHGFPTTFIYTTGSSFSSTVDES